MAGLKRGSARGDDLVAQAVIALYMKEPFFAHVVQGLPRRVDETTPTAAVALVDGGVELRVNPTFFAKLTKRDERVAVIKHEVLHVILKHLIRRGGRNPLLWNLACDIVVNDLLKPWPTLEGAITRKNFPELVIPEDATAEQVYDLLREGFPEPQPPEVGRSSAWDEEGKGDGDASDTVLVGPVAVSSDPTAVGGHSDHSAWLPAPGSQATVETRASSADALIDGLLVRAAERTPAHGWGSIPRTIRSAVDRARKRNRPQVDWRRVLRIFSASTGRTRLVTTNRRESPRYGRSTLPGQPLDPRAPTTQRLVPGNKIKRLNSLLVAIDTSGSIADAQLEAFFDEIHGIWRVGTHVTVVACDERVQESFLYKGIPPKDLGGRGGTAFDPVFLWVRAQPNRRFDGVVYLTDGLGPAPDVRPPCKLLWVVTNPGGLGEHLRFGRQILLR